MGLVGFKTFFEKKLSCVGAMIHLNLCYRISMLHDQLDAIEQVKVVDTKFNKTISFIPRFMSGYQIMFYLHS